MDEIDRRSTLAPGAAAPCPRRLAAAAETDPAVATGSAFTLIELLVVIAITALLVGLLLPALGAARDTARSVLCSANMRSIALASIQYADDHNEQVWTSTEWARIQVGPNQITPGHLYRYVDNVDEVTECPTNKRRSPYGESVSQLFADTRQVAVDFDYTMVEGTQGARLALETPVAYIDRVGKWFGGPFGAVVGGWRGGDQYLTRFPSTPLFVEESSYWYNGDVFDGRWGNLDQITQRHFGTGYIGYIDGTVRAFESVGDETREENTDFTANDIYVYTGGTRPWTRLYAANPAPRPFGWINAPRSN